MRAEVILRSSREGSRRDFLGRSLLPRLRECSGSEPLAGFIRIHGATTTDATHCYRVAVKFRRIVYFGRAIECFCDARLALCKNRWAIPTSALRLWTPILQMPDSHVYPRDFLRWNLARNEKSPYFLWKRRYCQSQERIRANECFRRSDQI